MAVDLCCCHSIAPQERKRGNRCWTPAIVEDYVDVEVGQPLRTIGKGNLVKDVGQHEQRELQAVGDRHLWSPPILALVEKIFRNAGRHMGRVAAAGHLHVTQEGEPSQVACRRKYPDTASNTGQNRVQTYK